MMKKALLATSCLFLLLAGCGKNETDYYPACTLTAEQGDTVLVAAKHFPSETKFPSQPYMVAMTDPIDSFDYNYMKGVLSYNSTDYNIAIYESTQPLVASLLKTGILGAEEDIQLSFRQVVGNSGYINGYKAEYIAGVETYAKDGKEWENYAVAYDLTLPGELDGTVLYVSCSDLDDIDAAKELLDEMVYSIHEAEDDYTEADLTEIEIINNDTESVADNIENVTDVASTEVALEELSFPTVELSVLEKGELSLDYEVDSNGYCRTIADLPFDVGIGYDEMFVVLSYYAPQVPTQVKIQTPTGNNYYKNDEYSYDGHYVFIIPSAKAGAYSLHIETYHSIYDCEISYMAKEVYYMTYLNLDENGEPLRGM